MSRFAPVDWILAAFIMLAVMLGGGGSPSPPPEILLELIALAALAAAAWHEPAPLPRLALAFALALLIVPALQLIPLPPSWWRGLPGRETEAAALALAGAPQRWMPLSISPPRTFASLLTLIVPAAAVVLAAWASPRGRVLMLATVAAMALLSALLGFAQLAGGEHSALRFYAASHAEDLTGFQANRNAEADVLIIGLLGVTALAALGPRRWQAAWFLAAGAVLVLGALGTSSRAGLALMGTVLAVLAAWFALTRVRGRRVGRRTGIAVAAAALGGVVLAWLLADAPVVQRILSRFADSAVDPRRELWSNTRYAIQLYWPWGSGIGTFGPAYIAAEPLESVTRAIPNRAHRDFLELALEAGLPGLLMLGVMTLALGWRSLMELRRAASAEHRIAVWFALATLAILAAHSIVDYPLRSMALAALAGVASGTILTSRRETGSAAISGREERFSR